MAKLISLLFGLRIGRVVVLALPGIPGPDLK